MNGEPREALTTADLAASANRLTTSVQADRPMLEAIHTDGVTQTAIKEDAKLAPLFAEDVAMDFRSRWDVVQRSFVDNPQDAVRAGDELVAQVIKSLAKSFANQRSGLEGRHEQTEEATTEDLRLSLRGYRSFFERLLSI
jgi:hypothetical protein